MKIKALLSNIALFALSLLAALLLCEAVVRIMGLAPEVVYVEKWRVRLSENPKIGFEPIPNLDSTGKSVQFYSYDGMSNNMGYRDYNHPLEKPPGSKRIIILGDSVAQGLWINDDSKIYSVVMEKRLRDLGHDVDVMNFGVSGYNTQQEVETLIDRGLRFDPDLVILGYCLNDKWQDDGGIYGALLQERNKAAREGKQMQNARLNPIVKHSDFLRFLKFVVIKQGTAKSGDLSGEVKALYNENNVEEYFGVLADLAEKHDFDVRVFIFPDFGTQDENLKLGWDAYPFASEHLKVKEQAQKNGLPHYDLFDLFKQCNSELGRNVSYDRYHPNPRGSECAGKKMAEYLSENWF